VCPNQKNTKRREITKHDTFKPTYIEIDGINYTTYICPKNDNNVNFNSSKIQISVRNKYHIYFVNDFILQKFV